MQHARTWSDFALLVENCVRKHQAAICDSESFYMRVSEVFEQSLVIQDEIERLSEAVGLCNDTNITERGLLEANLGDLRRAIANLSEQLGAIARLKLILGSDGTTAISDSHQDSGWFTMIPDEILSLIFCFHGCSASLSRTCKRFRDLHQDPHMWSAYYGARWKTTTLHKPASSDWYTTYKYRDLASRWRLGNVSVSMFRHLPTSESVNFVQYIPQRNWIVSYSSAGSLKLIDASATATMKCLATYQCEKGDLTVHYVDAERVLVSSFRDIILLSLPELQPVAVFHTEIRCISVVVLPCDQPVSTLSQSTQSQSTQSQSTQAQLPRLQFLSKHIMGTLYRWDASTPQSPIWTGNIPKGMAAAKLSILPRCLVKVRPNAGLVPAAAVVDPDEGYRSCEDADEFAADSAASGETEQVNEVEELREVEYILVASAQHVVALYDLDTMQELNSTEAGGIITAMACSGSYITVATDKAPTILTWNISTGVKRQEELTTDKYWTLQQCDEILIFASTACDYVIMHNCLTNTRLAVLHCSGLVRGFCWDQCKLVVWGYDFLNVIDVDDTAAGDTQLRQSGQRDSFSSVVRGEIMSVCASGGVVLVGTSVSAVYCLAVVGALQPAPQQLLKRNTMSAQ
eukprot:TRINITY_DN5650_c0_g2_i1.p1 TRINITY_DN5650_c0_g2~~TRINITY_DN5650_c0_g2_i1.p1  ORF type:complete len:630 (+),score=107.96 TRINITY_DN5650_c0_g2_i1:62-1951(+)